MIKRIEKIGKSIAPLLSQLFNKQRSGISAEGATYIQLRNAMYVTNMTETINSQDSKAKKTNLHPFILAG
jgi:hypothetical protein